MRREAGWSADAECGALSLDALQSLRISARTRTLESEVVARASVNRMLACTRALFEYRSFLRQNVFPHALFDDAKHSVCVTRGLLSSDSLEFLIIVWRTSQLARAAQRKNGQRAVKENDFFMTRRELAVLMRDQYGDPDLGRYEKRVQRYVEYCGICGLVRQLPVRSNYKMLSGTTLLDELMYVYFGALANFGEHEGALDAR